MLRLIRLSLILLAFAWVGGGIGPDSMGAAWAQAAQETQDSSPDYDSWQALATRADEAITSDRASTGVLEGLRSELAEARDTFRDVQGTNAARIASVNEQIAALGEPPADDGAEPDEIASRRADLNALLAQLRAPVLRALEAEIQAQGLIDELDALLRGRQAERLIKRGPSPLYPASWQEGLSELGQTLRGIETELLDGLSNPVRQAERREALPAIVAFFVLGLVLIVRARGWMERLTLRIINNGAGQGRAVWAALISLGQVALPLAGVFALVMSLFAAEILGKRGTELATVLPACALIVLAARWLAGRLFPKASVREPVFNLDDRRRAEARWDAAALGAVVALWVLVQTLATVEGWSDAGFAALIFPLLILAALLLHRIGRLLRLHVAQAAEGAEEPRLYRNSLIGLIARAISVIAVLAPLGAAIGYTRAATGLIFPAAATLWVIGLIMMLQRFVSDLWVMVRRSEEARESVIPVLFGLVFAILALPLLAWIWGARTADLTEIWARFTEGFQMGSSRIRPSDFIVFALVFGAGYVATRLFQGTMRTQVLPRTSIDLGGQKAIVSGLGYVGVFLAALIAITTTGIDLSSLAIVAGALSVGIGFGLQNIVSNFVSGIILLIERPVSEGDWIEVGGVMGTVSNISVRSTRIETFDRTDVIVPNSDLISGQVTNWTRQNLTGRVIIKIGVAYGSDTRRVQEILSEAAQTHPIVIVNPPPLVTFAGFGADSLDFEIRLILRDINYGLTVRSEINHEINRRFVEEGIEIPFAQRDIWLRNPEALQRPAARPVAPAPAVAQMRAEPDPDPDATQ